MKHSELRESLDEIRTLLGDLARRVAALEAAPSTSRAPAAAEQPPVAPAAPVPPVEEPPITEDIVIAITAAVAAFLGERAHVRQIRLISSSAWAQQGRVSVQASHRLSR